MLGTFTKNTLITFITQASTLVFRVGISIIIARILGPEGKGIYSLAMLLPLFLMYFTHFGIGSATVFYLGKRRYSSEEVFGNNIIYTILLSTFAILTGLVIIFFFSDKLFQGVAIQYLFLALLVVPLHLFLGFIVCVLLGLQKIRKYNFILSLRVFLFFALVGIFLWGFRFGIMTVIIAEISAFLITCIVLFFITKKETRAICLKPNKDYFKNSFLYGIKVYLEKLLLFLHYRIDMVLISIFLNPLMVGFYSLSAGLSEKIWLISDAVGTVLFPKISSETDKKKIKEFTPLIFRNVLFIITLLAILLLVAGHWLIILLYSDAFLKSIRPFQILLIGAVTISGCNILGNDLRGRGKPMLNTYITGASVILNITLNIFWIPKFGILGAAWATSISYAVALLITLIIYRKISGNRIKDIIFIKKSDLKFYQIS